MTTRRTTLWAVSIDGTIPAGLVPLITGATIYAALVVGSRREARLLRAAYRTLGCVARVERVRIEMEEAP